MKYKVGDIVKLRDDLEVYKYDVWLRIKGKPLTITEINCGKVYHRGKFISEGITIQSEEGLDYFVDDEMIEGLWEESCQQVKKDDKQAIAGDKDTVQQVTGKLKLIDILNKIANGELKEGTKVKYKGEEYTYQKDSCSPEEYDLYIEDRLITISDNCYLSNLNDEVELIEPNDFADVGKMAEPTDNTKIEELDVKKYYITGLYTKNYDSDMAIEEIIDKLNEVIRKLNKEG